MENSPKSGFPWNFTTVVTAQGYCYVKAYKMKWDPVLKKSKRHLQRHVGRLLEDDRINLSLFSNSLLMFHNIGAGSDERYNSIPQTVIIYGVIIGLLVLMILHAIKRYDFKITVGGKQ